MHVYLYTNLCVIYIFLDRWLIVWILVTFPDILTFILFISVLPLYFPPHQLKTLMFPILVTSDHLCPTIPLSIAPISNPLWKLSCFTLLVSTVTTGYISTSEHWNLGASNERVEETFVFLHMDYLINKIFPSSINSPEENCTISFFLYS